jgi:hypothetical protein
MKTPTSPSDNELKQEWCRVWRAADNSAQVHFDDVLPTLNAASVPPYWHPLSGSTPSRWQRVEGTNVPRAVALFCSRLPWRRAVPVACD